MLEIQRATTEGDLEEVRSLLMEYADYLRSRSLTPRNLELELDDLAGAYAPPDGALLVARRGGEVVACGGLRPLEVGICELKRLGLYRSLGFVEIASYRQTHAPGALWMELDLESGTA